MAGTITRRSAVGLLGAAGFASALVSRASSVPLPEGEVAATNAEGQGLASGSQIPAALQAGAPFGRWTVVEAHPVERGVLRVDVRPSNESADHVFSLEILARDPAPPSRPPAEVGALAIFVCNGGDGWLPTVEEQGLAAMTLASLLEKHGQTGPIEGLLTHADRVVAHGDVLHASFIAAELLA